MTHEELLQKLANIAHEKDAHEARNDFLLALLAVVELHKPMDNLVGEFCDACSDRDIYALYPCQTIQVIEKELK